MAAYKFDKIVTHLVTSGFVFAGSEIYGGLSNTWDYGPLGVEIKNNIRKIYWKRFVQESPLNVGLDSAILMNPRVWEATGHVASFNDPLIDCKKCRTRHRADTLIEAQFPDVNVQAMNFDQLNAFIKEHAVTCPNCGASDFTDIRQFNMMFKTHIGVTDDSKSEVYLRPETAQGIFVNFKNIQRSQRKKIPFGVVQSGKSFRNEITPGNFTFRTREFEQIEMEFFCAPGTDLEWFAYWKQYCLDFIAQLGVRKENLRYRDHDPAELAFYSKATTDIEYQFPFGWGEIWGIADRTDYDLRRHQEFSKESMEYLDPDTNEKYLPYVVEPSVGLDRLMLMVLTDSYDEEILPGDDLRIVMHIHPAIAAYKAAILPLSKKLNPKAEEVRAALAKDLMVVYDETGSIGKRYRRQDAIGTPFCITIDFQTLEDQQVTIRERDTMAQIRLPISEVSAYLMSKVVF
ncbi:MAG: glycine--tRNA ligase [Bacilli bacterium]|jgi:glycyl-tRNA synthetase|nr:glycine--tRNA ligase [Bacilli bacterium]MDD3388868.1 glycine--tRNA ligase [Bacilli bacterium]MDD4344678.1 glycine--tRNA ligase [Bacilli bacterium]MDD4520548.1 glycine--tRNA ligase [Bacilli bacterium]MDY0399240.1 glycine--tRNA ligase [Bacilli bacterium]